MLYQRHANALCWSRNGTGPRWGLLRSRLPLAPVQLRQSNAFQIGRATIARLIFLCALICFGRNLGAEDPQIDQASLGQSVTISEAQARNSVQWLADLALKKMPRTYDGDKDWGETKRVLSGLKVRREGFEIKTKRRWKEVEHGRWIKYELQLPKAKPDDQVAAKIHSVTKAGDLQTGAVAKQNGNARWEIKSSVEAPMTFTARVQRWNRGIRLYSMTIQGKMRVRLDSTSTLAAYADYSEVPPALVIDPRIAKAELFLVEFEVDRISKIGGDVAEEWGELMEKVVREAFLKRQNEKLTAKLNKAIDKQRDDLRLSMADWFASW